MLNLTKTIHVLALGLWFGTSVFFTFVVALSLFTTFERAAQREPQDPDRPAWFPVANKFAANPELRKEQGTRAAGAAVGPLFGWYFLLQGLCGFVATATALSWSWADPRSRLAKVRAVILVVALLTVVIGWPLEQFVSQLTPRRNEAREVLLNPAATEQQKAEAEPVRAQFALWHSVSVILNLVTVVLVTVAMALAAYLPISLPSPLAPTEGTATTSETDAVTAGQPRRPFGAEEG